MKFFNRNTLLFVVFVTGACVLVIEIVALRVLSPYYGNTIFSASSVITVILAALSIGYYAGGRLADAYPSPKLFYGIIVVSGLLVLFLELVGIVLLPFLGYRLSIIIGPLVASAILFFAPALLLGMLSPFVMKLQQMRAPQEGIGSISGKVFFWSTFGSIVGSLLAGFVLIPRFGVNEILLSTGVALVVLGSVGLLFQRIRIEAAGLIVGIGVVLAGSLFSTLWQSNDILYEKDGIYEKIVVYDGEQDGKAVRFLRQDRSSSSAMFLDSDKHVYEYTEYYALYKILKPNIKETLVIGAGAYTVPKALVRELPRVHVDVAEIEPQLITVGQQFFEVPDDSRLVTHVEDGRRFLHDSEKQYDLIFSDVYVFSIPAHFTTKEFFEIVKSKLSDEGVFIANVVGSITPEKPSFVFSEMKTLRSVFPQSYFFAVNSPEHSGLQNLIFVGHNSTIPTDFADSAIVESDDEFIASLPEKLIDMKQFDLTDYPELTDNFAPVEYLTAQTMQQAFQERN